MSGFNEKIFDDAFVEMCTFLAKKYYDDESGKIKKIDKIIPEAADFANKVSLASVQYKDFIKKELEEESKIFKRAKAK
jgi:hypothetical protein